MENKESIQNFSDMVTATEKLTKPWRIALFFTNLMWAIVFAAFILLAYLTPETNYQMQNYDTQMQQQASGYSMPYDATNGS